MAGELAVALRDHRVRDAGCGQACGQPQEVGLAARRDHHRERPRRGLFDNRLAGGVDGLRGGDTWREIDPHDDV